MPTFKCFESTLIWIGEMAQQVGTPAVLAEGLSLVLRTHVKWLTTTCDSSLGELRSSSGLCGGYGHVLYSHTQINKNKINLKAFHF